MRIRKFVDSDFQSLINFNNQFFSHRDTFEELIKYRLINNPLSTDLSEEILIATDEDRNIIGQILMMPSEFYYQKSIFPAYWGIDYFVKPENRNSLAGVLLATKAAKTRFHFGIGFTETSFKIFSTLKEKHIGNMTKYIRPISFFAFFKNVFENAFNRKKSFNFPDLIKVDNVVFNRINIAEELISSSGFWNSDLIEFTRSKSFIDWRFFYYPGKYKIYKFLNDSEILVHKPTYFVLKPIVWKNVDCLLLVDYRFDLTNKDMFAKILESTMRLAKQLKMGAIITGCSLPSCNKILKNKMFFSFGNKFEILTKFPSQKKDEFDFRSDTIFVTFADADCEFNIGD